MGKTILITGANRGIGRGMFDHYVIQPDNTLIAAVRDVEGAQGLVKVPRGQTTKVLITKIDSSSKTDPYDAVKDIEAKGVNHIDVVISSAGIAPLNTIEDLPLEEYEHALMVNGISVMLLYKATLPLLRKAPHPARFAFISAAGGSLNEMPNYPYPNASYGSSKALANYLVVKMGMENDWLITLCIHPGLVQTELGNAGARAFGLEKAPVTLEESSKNTAFIIDNSTKEEHSQKFFNQTIDKIHPW
ncbi:aflatoxin biosynthesis ketoreductase-like protein nor-1 [Hypoxylon trugodes]|uniref:aflatoxin biosynthesis ketoreductase-like protein nor-1 n=1 Tax=Hypoxylon trugodes TaxID=326681 RepID=UPI00218FD003|nr:aflatoxin biosynthesis ketoreductase-like protein nor-1 [Hypoxylon trugodes]KAI1385915.1 aflatoxin biosynthesis ketoreductase-like protein nor-1 [Hypoxylon trugodes]